MRVEEVQAVRDRLRTDTPFWAGGVSDGRPPSPGGWHGAARILDKRRQLVPLIARPWQLEFDAALEAQRAAGEPMRAIVLKARKLGFSTWVAAKFLQRVTQWPNQHAIIVAQDTGTAGEIFRMAERMYSHLPSEQELGLDFSIKPEIISHNGAISQGRASMVFGERSRRLRLEGRSDTSILEIDTAKTPEAKRGFTPSMIHGSEVAWWENPGKLVGLLNGVPDVEETIVVLESTANGLNHFQKRWLRAVEGEEDPDVGGRYVPVFAPWWRDPDCQQAFATPEARERFVATIGHGPYGEDEEALVELHGCTPEQLLWRRTTIRDRTEDSVELFHQEYPSTPEEAFIGSGRTVFSGILIARAIKAAEEEPKPVKGTLRATEFRERSTRGGATLQVPTSVVWVPEAQALRGEPLLEVWEHPVTAEQAVQLPAGERPPEGSYVVTVDVAEGEANTFTVGDFHAVTVWDHRSRWQVAQHESRMDIHDLPMWCMLVGVYFNTAWLAVEVNGPGIAVVDPLQKDFRYPRMFRRKRYDSKRDVEVTQMGWKTDKVTKPMIEVSFGQALKEETHGVRSLRLARQASSYVIDDRGRHGAQEGEHDDLLMSAMIAHQVMDVLRPPRAKREGRRQQRARDDVTGW